MIDNDKSKNELLSEVTELQSRVADLELLQTRCQNLENELHNYRTHVKELIRVRTTDLTRINQHLQEEIIERRRIEKDLRHQTEQLSMVLDTLPIVPYTWESKENLRINYVSYTIEKLSGYSPKQFLEDRNFWAAHIHPEDRNRVLSEVPEIIGMESHSSVYRFRIADDSYRWFNDVRRVVMSQEGTIHHIAGTWQDITEEKMLRQESEYRLQQIIQADKLASLGEVVAGVAHEINNPNSFITYNIPILEETWRVFKPILLEYAATRKNKVIDGLSLEELSHDMEDIIQAIKSGSERINKVVTDLKDFVRLDDSIPTKPVQANEVVNRTLTIVGSQARKSVDKIDLLLAEDLPEVNGNFFRIEQVVANLVLNAAQAIPDRDSGRIVISTRFVKRLNAVLISVADNGIGMKPEVLSRLFEPFFTTRRETGGTGLGLSVSYGLIQEQNGIIGVMSRPLQGTKFTLFLPVERRNSKLAELRPTILCVDDEDTYLDMLRSFFGKVENIAFETSHSPESVVDFLDEHPEVDIVLSDVNMPGINGWELLEMIKTRYPLLPVILYSGDPKALHSPKAGLTPDFLLEKPFSLKHLIEVITKIGRQRL